MTATTNGASLEDCHTNIFSLIDLNGIRWKSFRPRDNNNYNFTSIDTHPILTTYAKCIEQNHIAVWRHEPQKSQLKQNSHSNPNATTNTPSHHSHHQSSSSANSHHHRQSSSTTPTNPNINSRNLNSANTNSNNNYELWIFGYGNQLVLDNVIDDDLVEFQDETWDTIGLSYECRTLLFKALHNLVERCFLSEGFVRLGSWFVQPSPDDASYSPLCNHQLNNVRCPDDATHPFNHSISKIAKMDIINSITSPNSRNKKPSNQNLAISLSSSIKRMIDSQSDIYRPCRALNGIRNTSLRSTSNTYFTTSLDGTRSSLSFSFNFFVHGDCTICCAIDVREHPLVYSLCKNDLKTFQEGGIIRVIIAPYGLNGVLNGVNQKDSDNETASTKFLQRWSKFYPLPKTASKLDINQLSKNQQNFNQSSSTSKISNDHQIGSRSYLSNLTNMFSANKNRKQYSRNDPQEVPPVVEVIVAGFRMRYPSEFVLTTTKSSDPYKFLSNPDKEKSSDNLSRKSNKTTDNLSRTSRLALLSEKLTNEDKQKSSEIMRAKIKIENNQDNNETRNNFGIVETNKKLSEDVRLNTYFNSSTTKSTQDKDTNCLDNDCNTYPSNNQSGAPNSSRYGSKKFTTNSTILAPTDFVKLFPTPPSLEQMNQSPSNLIEESMNTKETSSPTTVNYLSLANATDNLKEKSMFVYKPEICAIVSPSPKWAPLIHVSVSSPKSLPFDCVYKPETRLKQNPVVVKMGSKNHVSTNSPNLLPIKSANTPSLPLTDQTNTTVTLNHQSKMNSPQIKTTNLLSYSLLAPNEFLPTPASVSISSPLVGSLASATKPPISSTFSPFTLPHQRLFNNLNEINSIQLNLMLSDSAFGMFKDHNFESCTLCVCNMSIKGLADDIIPERPPDSQASQDPFSSENNNQSIHSNAEYINECTCGFSAIANRQFSHLSGLFFEDELEVTNIIYDPTEMIDLQKTFKRFRLSSYPESILTDDDKRLKTENTTNTSKDTKVIPSDKKCDRDTKLSSHLNGDTANDKLSPATTSNLAIEETKLFVIEELKRICSTTIHPNSSLSKFLLAETFRNNRYSTSCKNYLAQYPIINISPFDRFPDGTKKSYLNIKPYNQSPESLRFTDYCEITKKILTKLHGQSAFSSQITDQFPRSMNLSRCPPQQTNNMFTNPMFSRLLGQDSCTSSNIGKKPNENVHHNLFLRGLRALVSPTLNVDPKGALQLLEQLKQDDSKLALGLINRAIVIFSTPIHDWQFIPTQIPNKNFDTANLLKCIQPLLETSIGNHNRMYKDFLHQQQRQIFSSRDSPTGEPVVPTPPCQGPLTWKQFHQAAARGSEDQSEPQPIPSILIGHHVERNHLALSPFALKFWDKLLLEPYAPSNNTFYLVIAPDISGIAIQISSFFRELSNTFELHKLGKHTPILNESVRVPYNTVQLEDLSSDDSFFASLKLDPVYDSFLNKLKAFSTIVTPGLAKKIVDFFQLRLPPYDPSLDRFTSSPQPANSKTVYPNTISQPIISSSNKSFLERGQQQEFNMNNSFNNESQLLGGKSQTLTTGMANTTISSNPIEDGIYQEEEANKQNGIVIYIVDPFSASPIKQNMKVLASIALFRCYSQLLELLPENLQRIAQLQIISLDSIVSHSRPVIDISKADELKTLSLNIYSRCRKILTNHATAKSLTGFGPAASLVKFFKSEKQKNALSKIFAPPFILAPMKDKQTELGEMFGDQRERSSVIFCSYCLTEDQKWLVASLTNDKGEMSETTVINISVHDRMKNPHVSVKRSALRKMMDFVISVMSEWVNPWRLVIGKLGRVGHGELREWAAILSKRSLLNYSRQLNDKCRQCSILPPLETVSILSACLVSLEPDTKLRIMPDQFTNDDRQASFNKCPLNTPDDATATHILVFPTSASIQAPHFNVDDPLGNSGLDDDLGLGGFDDGIEDLGPGDNIDALFTEWDEKIDLSDEPNVILNGVSGCNIGSRVGSDAHQDPISDETLQLLQQPLALGFFVSTAKTGPMPNWFWSTCQHAKTTNPVFLKSALHIHIPCVQLPDDLIAMQSKKSHQLDSNLTADVLRYVLEGYNALSWLSLNPKTYDRQSCLPVHMQNLLQLYHLLESFS